MRKLFLAISMGLLAMPVFASGNQLNLHQGSFDDQAGQIRAELADGDAYSEIDSNDRLRVMELLDRIGMHIERAGSVDSLPEHRRVAVFNDQEQINAILTQASEDSRLVCRRERVTGTRRITTECMTVAERRRTRDQALELMRAQPAPTMWGN